MGSSHLSVSECQTDKINLSNKAEEESAMNIKRVGIDLAKQVFQAHGVVVGLTRTGKNRATYRILKPIALICGLHL